jgi:hypothetical protein
MTDIDLSVPMLAADLAAIGYTLWIGSRSDVGRRARRRWCGVAVGWLAVLHLGLSSRALVSVDLAPEQWRARGA